MDKYLPNSCNELLRLSRYAVGGFRQKACCVGWADPGQQNNWPISARNQQWACRSVHMEIFANPDKPVPNLANTYTIELGWLETEATSDIYPMEFLLKGLQGTNVLEEPKAEHVSHALICVLCPSSAGIKGCHAP